MLSQANLRGVFVLLIALGFGLNSFRYPMGQMDSIGPGLFPLGVSAILLIVAAAMLVRNRLVSSAPLEFQIKNISVIIASLVVFAVLSNYVNMIVALVAMVFCASMAMRTYSTKRNLAIAAGLIAIAFAFDRLLGLQLNLI